ncbi:myosin-2 heavy chain, non muscle [Selaginella moellendorffii]|uniref:myosin-2 heavy chain, non muscle n=1 Tax=Selaginella moellendorffii TaxID=88036 RepID=UPI000D1CF08C|nr:myosin-2 heavy chain, non muscle [Selaginella moellendorffii]|eukprot:XP_024539524.1 myosin-2 heavy chain, non muscle [Selaginella moellendorffii]
MTCLRSAGAREEVDSALSATTRRSDSSDHNAAAAATAATTTTSESATNGPSINNGRESNDSALQTLSPREMSPKKYEHPVLTPYNRRLSKNTQYFETWQHRTNIASSGGGEGTGSNKRGSVVTPSPRKLPSIEKKEKIASLTEENEFLSKEVRVLCKDKSSLAAQVSQLEDDLSTILAKTHDLVHENSNLSSQVDDTRIQIWAKDSMMASLAKAKSILESEKQYLQEDKGFLENQLLEINKKLRETAKRADEAESTVASVVQQIDGLNRNLARMSKNDASFEVQEIVKQMELHSLQACKDMLKKELKKLTATVIKAREEATEAKMVIDNCRADETKFKADVVRLEKALKSASEYSGRLEKQEKLLKSNIELFDARVRSLENELSFVKAERDAAIKAKIQKEAASGGMEAIKASIHILHENAKKGHEQVLALSGLLPELAEDKARSVEVSKTLEMKARELGARSTTVATAAEEQLGKLKEQVDALDSALEEAKDAAEESESKAWQMIAELSSSSPASQASGDHESSGKVDLPAATTYILGLGLLAYSVYISNHA